LQFCYTDKILSIHHTHVFQSCFGHIFHSGHINDFITVLQFQSCYFYLAKASSTGIFSEQGLPDPAHSLALQ